MLIPLSLYIHIPWCVRKCPYCDFNSHQLYGELPEKAYLDALIADFENDIVKIGNRSIQSIFIGGGTPSLLSASIINQLLQEIRKRVDLDRAAEITMEANPGTVEQQRFIDFRQAGVNRLSLGIQSFQDSQLKALGRIHNSQQAHKAIAAVERAEFSNYNIDLMYGLPQQTIAEACSDLQIALTTSATHLSWYQLTLEPNTIFHKRPPPLPSHDQTADMQEQGQSLIAECGFEQYEISAYSRSGYQCQHNLNYWQFGDYLGIGAGAHSKLTDGNNFTITRTWKYKQPQLYLDSKQPFIAGQQTINANELPLEFMLNALRLTQPLSLQLFSQRTGLSALTILPTLTQLEVEGFISLHSEQLTLTDQGQQFLNELLEHFLPLPYLPSKTPGEI